MSSEDEKAAEDIAASKTASLIRSSEADDISSCASSRKNEEASALDFDFLSNTLLEEEELMSMMYESIREEEEDIERAEKDWERQVDFESGRDNSAIDQEMDALYGPGLQSLEQHI